MENRIRWSREKKNWSQRKLADLRREMYLASAQTTLKFYLRPDEETTRAALVERALSVLSSGPPAQQADGGPTATVEAKAESEANGRPHSC